MAEQKFPVTVTRGKEQRVATSAVSLVELQYDGYKLDSATAEKAPARKTAATK